MVLSRIGFGTMLVPKHAIGTTSLPSPLTAQLEVGQVPSLHSWLAEQAAALLGLADATMLDASGASDATGPGTTVSSGSGTATGAASVVLGGAEGFCGPNGSGPISCCSC